MRVQKRSAGTVRFVIPTSLKAGMRGVFSLLSPGKEFRPVSAGWLKRKEPPVITHQQLYFTQMLGSVNLLVICY